MLGDEVLLGTVPMDMDLVVNPARRMVTVDPASPNLPHARVKQGAHNTLIYRGYVRVITAIVVKTHDTQEPK